jgi:hypothetical protein
LALVAVEHSAGHPATRLEASLLYGVHLDDARLAGEVEAHPLADQQEPVGGLGDDVVAAEREPLPGLPVGQQDALDAALGLG